MTSEKLYDFVIFGATGTTGKYCVEYLAKCLQKEGLKRTWAVAGRNVGKVKETRDEVAQLLDTNLDHIAVIEADVKNEDSIVEMCKSCRVLINLVGPYNLYGEPVVRACIKTGTHHLDISGEPQFLEKMQVELHKDAQEAGVYVVGCCGMDSLPCDVGVNFLKDQFKPKVLNNVSEFVTAQGGPSGFVIGTGTWNSVINAFAQFGELGSIRKKLYTQYFKKAWPKFKYPASQRILPFKDPIVNKWCIPFWDVDKTNVKRTQWYNYEHFSERPVEMDSYYTIPNFLFIFKLSLVAFALGLLGIFQWGRNLLQRYPSCFTFGVVSKKGPTRQQILESSFMITLVGKGWDEQKAEEQAEPPNHTMSVVIKGPNPVYVVSSLAIIAAGITLLEESDKLPEKGGVVTPGVVFRRTAIAERLGRNGLTFEVVSDV